MWKKLVSLASFLLVSVTALAENNEWFFPETVPNLDIPSYMGRWYQLASTEPFFQKGCVCVTAQYELQDNSTVKVTNTCRKTVDGPDKSVIGTAYQPDASVPAKLNVKFGSFPMPFTNYWVVDLDPDYKYAVVSTAFWNPIWILSRTSYISPELYEEIVGKLKERGFNINNLVPTIQLGCWK